MTETEKVTEETPKTQPTAAGIPLKTIVLIVLLALIAVILVFVAVLPKKTLLPQNLTNQEKMALGETTLSIGITSVDKLDKTKYSSNVLIDTGKNKVFSAELELSFDPKAITNVKITAGSFLPNATELLKTIDTTTGRIVYAVSVPVSQNEVSGKGVLATITYSPVSSEVKTLSTISFLPKTDVRNLEYDATLLKSTEDGIVYIAPVTP